MFLAGAKDAKDLPGHCFDISVWSDPLYRFDLKGQYCAGISLTVATLCNLASPVVTGILFEILTGGQPFSQYPKFLAVLGTLYIVEPLVARVYIKNACAAGEKVCVLASPPLLTPLPDQTEKPVANLEISQAIMHLSKVPCFPLDLLCTIIGDAFFVPACACRSCHQTQSVATPATCRSLQHCAWSFSEPCCSRRWSSLTGTTPQS